MCQYRKTKRRKILDGSDQCSGVSEGIETMNELEKHFGKLLLNEFEIWQMLVKIAFNFLISLFFKDLVQR